MSHDYVWVVQTSPVEGREDDFNDWYDNVHLPDILAIPGVESGRRFHVLGGNGKPSYCAIYELSCPPDEVIAAMMAGITDGSIPLTDALDAPATTMTSLKAR